MRRQLGEPLSGERADDVHGNAGGDRRDLRAAPKRIGAQIGLVEDDDRGRPALRGEHERALEAPQVEVAVQAGHEEHAVRVGGHYLLGRGRARHLA